MNYWWGVFKSKEEKSSIERFIKRFEISKDEDEYKMLLNDYTIPASSLTLLAHAYQKSGDFEKSIAIYLLALKRVCEKDEKEYLLYNLGKTYYKAGFMRRATEMFLEVLRLNPRNQKSLKYLTVVYEQLKEYDRALEVIDVLEELGTDVKDQKNYLKSLKIDTNNLLNDTQKLQMLKELSFEYELIQRVIFEFLLKNKLHVHYSDVDFIQPKLVMDLLWYLDDDKVELELVKEIGRAHV